MENYNTFGKNIYEFIQFIKKIMDKTNDDLEKEIGICSRNFSKWKNGVEPEKNTLSAIYDYSKRSIECTKRLENNGIMSFNDFYLALHKTDFYEIITDCIDKEKKDNSFEEKERNIKERKSVHGDLANWIACAVFWRKIINKFILGGNI